MEGALETTKSWLAQGILGSVALLCLAGLIYLFRLLTAERKTHIDQLERLVTTHKTEIVQLATAHKSEQKILEERLVSKAETWMSQYHESNKAQTAVLTAMERRESRARRGEGG